MSRRNPKVSLATARVIPVFLFAAVAYASYVVVGPLSINFLFHPPHGQPRRAAAGYAIPIVHFLLVIPVAATWLRMTLVIFTDPGYIRQGPEQPLPILGQTKPLPAGLDSYWRRDVFICDPSGLPIWCSRCHNWKPDRTHHNQDVGRCTRKMDHFCPWVGGVVGENSLKFFIQFTGYSTLLTLYNVVVYAYFCARYKENPQFFVVLGLAAFLLLMTLGLFMNSTQLACCNKTTIEQTGPGPRSTYLAIIISPDQQRDAQAPSSPSQAYLPPDSSGTDSERPLNSDLDDPAHKNYFQNTNRQSRRSRRNLSSIPQPSPGLWKGTITYPLELPVDRPPLPAPAPRTYAIVELPSSLNPWNLGNIKSNLSQVLGTSLYDWFLPIKHSPCRDHSSAISEFPLGPDFEKLIKEAGLVQQGKNGRNLPPSI